MLEEEKVGTPIGRSGSGSGNVSGSVLTPIIGAGIRDSGGTPGGTGNGDGNSGDGGPIASPKPTSGNVRPNVAVGDKRPPIGRVNPGTGGVQPSIRGDNPRGERGGEGGSDSRSGAVKQAETPAGRLVGGVGEKEKPDAEEKPERPLFVGIPQAGNATKQTAKSGKVKAESESVAQLVSAAFELPVWGFQRLIPLEKGHLWWRKDPEEIHDSIAVPLTEIINGLSPKTKKMISGNMNTLLLVAGIATACMEPIEMEFELRRQIRIEQIGRLRQAGESGGGSGRNAVKRPASYPDVPREAKFTESDEENAVGVPI